MLCFCVRFQDLANMAGTTAGLVPIEDDPTDIVGQICCPAQRYSQFNAVVGCAPQPWGKGP
jgi:hypothetical protein